MSRKQAYLYTDTSFGTEQYETFKTMGEQISLPGILPDADPAESIEEAALAQGVAPSARREADTTTPQWRLIRLDHIDFHPETHFPSDWQTGFLTPAGIRLMARFTPIQVLESGTRFQCFAGVRLFLAAKDKATGLAEIESLVYPSIADIQISAAFEMELDILPIWHRQTPHERKKTDERCLTVGSSHRLRSEWNGSEQEKWKTILRMSLRSLQNLMNLLRDKA